jgi:flagellar hook protein FlgE
MPVDSTPGDNGSATLVAGAVELSNTDIGRNLVDTMLASKMFRANAIVFSTTDRLLDELTNLSRRPG